MFYFILLFLEVATLFFLSRKMSKTLSKFISINFLSFLFLPGVIIHELSHLLISVILFVRVGNMEFTPKKSDNGFKLGSIEIAKTDIIRRSVIGFAPVFVGLTIIIGIVYLFSSITVFLEDKNTYVVASVILVITYILFAVSNTMFSSSRDMEGTVETLIALLIIFASAYILGFRPSLDFAQNLFTRQIVYLLQKTTLFLSVPIMIDIVLLGIMKLIYKRK